MKIAFLMDPLGSIDPLTDTTAHLMYECNQRGHMVYFLEPHDIYIRKNQIVARMHNMTGPQDVSMRRYWRRLIQAVKKEHLLFEKITELDVLFLRKNPPLDYQTLETLAPLNHQLFIINSTNGQIVANSKLYPLNFPDLIPETHISRDPARLRKIINDFGGTMLIKPLERYGGEGVIKVSSRDRENLNSLIDYYVKAYEEYPGRQPIMVQAYLEEVQRQGDVRILLLNGEILGAMRRKPRKGDFRTNTLAGGIPCKHEITRQERAVCDAIKGDLIQNGLYFVGIDVVEGKLVGINCVSPGGIPHINRLSRVKLEKKVIDFIEAQVG
jgi:glutathione synthase